jgi:two-component system cell cycle sensor histidine kinase/response regulator CckA
MEILTRLNAPRAHVRVDPLQIEWVLFQLSAHTRAALTDRGVLLIDTDTVYVGPAFLTEHPGSATGEHVCLTVRNTGAGIDASVLPHIFEPFFAAAEKPDTGLGLAVVFGIVQQSGGFIRVQTTKGQGTVFEIYFPRVYDPLISGLALTRTVPSKARDATILVAEDDDAVRALVVQILRKRGYQVLEASNGEQALEIAQSHPGAIDLLLTDIIMPFLGGYGLQAKMQELRPEIRTLYMSGYASDDLLQRGFPADEGLHLVEKPFTPDLLVEKVREVLGRRTSNADLH